MSAPPPPAIDLPSQYDPAAVEVALYRTWMQAGYFTADPQRVRSGERRPFSIVLPPPNVTGNLHVGHALDHTIMDILSRWHRMSGDEVLWLPGMDHAGIATQNVVEKQLAVDGKTRHDFGRELFVEKVWDWKAESGGAILGQMKRLGDSVDWSRERFTLDDGLSAAVQTIFKRLYDDGLIYRAERITNWCPGCLTALSDIEVEHVDDDGELVSLRYSGDGFDVVVATTRVETMLGDTAVAVHPADERYAHLVGRTVTLPLVGREIPIVADDFVDPAFGTGAVKVTPAHDPNDFEIGRRHGLPMPTILTEDARITGTGTVFDGLDRFAARAAVKEALRAQGRVVAERIPFAHAVGHCSRSDDVVEPRLSLQWFVKVGPLARAAGDAVRDGRTTIHPPELAARFFDWVDNMHDWTISRQLWWGHRIPVWYGPDGEIRCVGPDEDAPGEGWIQDPDVLDTWFSSGLWPFSTMGWPDDTETLAAFYPTSVLVTGYDILFFWVARMMMFGLYATGRVPFATVALHGLVRDQFGKKMSKSRGNVVDPLAWIERYGADAVRLTLARGANPGTDQAIAEDWVKGARNFCTKLFNATRFALLNGARVSDTPPAQADLTAADRWILGRLDEVTAQTSALLADFQFGKAADGVYQFAWSEMCDWYLELAKIGLRDPERADGTRAVLGTVLDRVLTLLHPFIPFVTESLWTVLTGRETLVTAPWPDPAAAAARVAAAGAGAGAFMADLEALVTAIRRFRADQGLPPAKAVPARIIGADPLREYAAGLTRLAGDGPDFAATAQISVLLSTGTATVQIDTSTAIDAAAERARLLKERAAAEKELADADRKLGNTQFMGKAPEHIVAGIRARHERARTDLDRIAAALADLGGVTGPDDPETAGKDSASTDSAGKDSAGKGSAGKDSAEKDSGGADVEADSAGRDAARGGTGREGTDQDPDRGYRGFARSDYYDQFPREGYDPDGYDAPAFTGDGPGDAGFDGGGLDGGGSENGNPFAVDDDADRAADDPDPTGEIAAATADLDDDSDALLVPDSAPLTLEVVEAQLDRRRNEVQISPTLDRIAALVDVLGHPERAYPVVHVAGTNGKTSTTRMIDALLARVGLRTGRFTSPHLQSVTERISIDGVPVSADDYVATYADIAPFVDIVDARSRAGDGIPLSKFEILTAMAFAAFAEAPVEVAVLETGLGGTWDSTNVADGQVAVITPIGIDHTEYLGDTIGAIAGHKAGIIGPGAVAVIGRQDPEALEVLLRRAVEVDATVARFGAEFTVEQRDLAVGGQRLTLRGLAGVYPDIYLPLSGAHQAENAAVALAAVEAFFGAGPGRALDLEAVQDAFATVSSPGRLERIATAPSVFVDAAHNPHGAAALAVALREEFAFSRLVGVLAVLADKDVRGVLSALADTFDEVVVTANGSPRALPVADLREVAEDVFGAERVHTSDRLDGALALARELLAASDQDGDPDQGGDPGAGDWAGAAIVVTGSVVTAGEARAAAGRAPA